MHPIKGPFIFLISYNFFMNPDLTIYEVLLLHTPPPWLLSAASSSIHFHGFINPRLSLYLAFLQLQ